MYTTAGLCRRHYRRERAGKGLGSPFQKRRTRVEIMERLDVEGIEHKRCSKCELWCPIGEYTTSPQAADGLFQYCKLCAAAYRHGTTRDILLGLLESQGYRCAVCDKGIRDDYVIDHDHSCCAGQLSCGQCIRGLLCAWCNVSLGRFNDSAAGLKRALIYLENYGRNKQ